jgi:hypothetical protein
VYYGLNAEDTELRAHGDVGGVDTLDSDWRMVSAVKLVAGTLR